MPIKTLSRSFAGGEIAPEAYARLDLAKHQTGLAQALNFFVLPHGPACNRSGTEHVIEVKNSSKATVLLPFIFSVTQAYVLEFGEYYMRIHALGATLLNATQNISGISNANPGVLTYAGADPANGTWMYLSGIGGMTELNGRYVKVANVNAGANTFELTDFAGNNINTSTYGVYTSGGTIAPVYEIVTPYAEADLFDLHFTQSSDVMTITHPGYQQRHLSRIGATNWTLNTFTLAPTIGTPNAPTLTTGGPGGGTPVTVTYLTTAIANDGLEESIGSSTASTSYDLTVSGNYINVDPTPGGATVSGAVRYNVYKGFNGLYGYIGQTDGSAFRDNNVTPDVSKTPPNSNDPFTSSGNYPGAVGYYQGRRWFAGTTNKPQNVWATRSGTESNMSYSIPQRDDDSIAFRLTARQANTIRHIVPLNDLLLLTSGAEWLVTTLNSDAITPSSINYKPQGYSGASNVTPVVTNDAILFAQARGGHVREMRYSWERQGYPANDISLMAPHMFDAYTIVSMAYAQAPHHILWCVRSDGKLLGCTYMAEQQVVGWHLHSTDGYFEAVCTIPEGNEDAVYFVVRRTIDGRTVRHIERLHTRVFTDLEDAFFVDNGLTYSGAATTTITGLWHLEGESVVALADGAVVRNLTVTNGAVTLEQSASVVHIGKAITAYIETLPLALQIDSAFGQGVQKNVNAMHLNLHRSSGVKAGPTLDKLVEVKQRTNEPYGTPPALITGTRKVDTTANWDTEGSMFVVQENPLPATIRSLVMEVAVGG